MLVKVRHKAGNRFQLEQPARSLVSEFTPVKDALKITDAKGFQRDACVDGAPWRKPLILFTATLTFKGCSK